MTRKKSIPNGTENISGTSTGLPYILPQGTNGGPIKEDQIGMLSYVALDRKIEDGLEIVANDLEELLPYLLEMHTRLRAPGSRTDLRKDAPANVIWTEWVRSKQHRFGLSLRSVQRLLRGKTEASRNWRTKPHDNSREVPSYRADSDGSDVQCGDCIEVMGRMPAESIDLVVTSPPYNLLNSTGNGIKGGFGYSGIWQNPKLAGNYDSHDDAMPHEDYVRWQRQCLASMMRLLKGDGAIFYVHKWRVQGGLLQDRADIVTGFPVRQIIIWDRKGGVNFNPGYFLPTYEVLYLICKAEFRLAPHANAKGDVWQIAQDATNPHPAPFPVELARRCIESTNAEIVLDPFMGSGTSAIAAELCNRRWIGIDKSEHYCNMANERIKAARRVKVFAPAA